MIICGISVISVVACCFGVGDFVGSWFSIWGYCIACGVFCGVVDLGVGFAN